MYKQSINWLSSKGLPQGIFWIIISSFFSNLGDISIRLVSDHMPAMQITFFRFFFGVLVLLPIMLYKGKTAFVIKNKSWHLLRIIIGFGAIACWIYGTGQTSLASVTTISFACPILILPLAYIFLNEKSDWRRILSVLVGFLGVLIIAFFEKSSLEKTHNILFFHPGIVFLFIGAVLFSFSDILNKKMLASENLFSLLFYFCLGSALIGLVPALLVWQSLLNLDILYLLLSGSAGVCLLYCILKATNAAELSSIMPYKYFELVFSIVMSYILFKEIIRMPTIIGALLIIPSALLIAYYEINKTKKNEKIK